MDWYVSFCVSHEWIEGWLTSILELRRWEENCYGRGLVAKGTCVNWGFQADDCVGLGILKTRSYKAAGVESLSDVSGTGLASLGRSRFDTCKVSSFDVWSS